MNAPVGFWKSKNGVMRSIASLDPGHLTNCIALVGRMIDSAQVGIDAFEPYSEHDFDYLYRMCQKLAVLRAKQDELVVEKCLRIDHECEECDGTGYENPPRSCVFCDGKGYYIPSELRDFPPQPTDYRFRIKGVQVPWTLQDCPTITTVEEYEVHYGKGSCPPIVREILRERAPKPPLQATYRDPTLYNAAKDWYFKTQVKT